MSGKPKKPTEEQRIADRAKEMAQQQTAQPTASEEQRLADLQAGIDDLHRKVVAQNKQLKSRDQQDRVPARVEDPVAIERQRLEEARRAREQERRDRDQERVQQMKSNTRPVEPLNPPSDRTITQPASPLTQARTALNERGDKLSSLVRTTGDSVDQAKKFAQRANNALLETYFGKLRTATKSDGTQVLSDKCWSEIASEYNKAKDQGSVVENLLSFKSPDPKEFAKAIGEGKAVEAVVHVCRKLNIKRKDPKNEGLVAAITSAINEDIERTRDAAIDTRDRGSTVVDDSETRGRGSTVVDDSKTRGRGSTVVDDSETRGRGSTVVIDGGATRDRSDTVIDHSERIDQYKKQWALTTFLADKIPGFAKLFNKVTSKEFTTMKEQQSSPGSVTPDAQRHHGTVPKGKAGSLVAPGQGCNPAAVTTEMRRN